MCTAHLHWPYMLQQQPNAEVNKFEQVSSDDHQMSLVSCWGQGVPRPMSRGASAGVGKGTRTVSSYASWVMSRMTDWRTETYMTTLLSHNFVGGH